LIEKIKLFPAKERYILVESVYSMSGDVCPIHEIAEICRKENIYLIVDEAHSFGIFGEQGKGLAYPFAEVCVAIIIPLGKAAGSYGALVVCSEEIKNYLINFSRPWIFSTAIPPALAEISLKHVKEVIKMDDLRKKLFDNIRIFDSHSPIVSIPCAGNDEVKKLSLYLAEKGFAQKPILSPTVPIGKERIRIVLHAFNTTDEVLRLREHLSY
jgi:8-amino-7-oxononanoate synthase